MSVSPVWIFDKKSVGGSSANGSDKTPNAVFAASRSVSVCFPSDDTMTV